MTKIGNAGLGLLKSTRIATFISIRPGGFPIGVPVWFDWNGTSIRLFTAKSSRKLGRLQQNPNASLLVHNHIYEAEAWIAFDGEVVIKDQGGIDLAETLASRYWDLGDPEKAEQWNQWKAYPDAFALLEMHKPNIREGR